MSVSTLPIKLKYLRKLNNYSQQRLSNKINISRQAYSLYETGKRVPNLETLVSITQLYNVSIDFLVADCDNAQVHELDDVELFGKYLASSTDDSRYENIAPAEKQLLQLFSQVSFETQQEVIALLKSRIEKQK